MLSAEPVPQRPARCPLSLPGPRRAVARHRALAALDEQAVEAHQRQLVDRGQVEVECGAARLRQVLLAVFRLAFFRPANAACLSDGLALNRTAAPAFTSTFPPVRGFSAVRLGVSRTVKEPKSGSEKRPVSTISARIAATTSPASRPAALAGMSAARAMTSVRNLFDMRSSFAAGRLQPQPGPERNRARCPPP